MKSADIGNSATLDCAYGVMKRLQGESTVIVITGTKKRQMQGISKSVLKTVFAWPADHPLPKLMKEWLSARTAGSDSSHGGKHCS